MSLVASCIRIENPSADSADHQAIYCLHNYLGGFAAEHGCSTPQLLVQEMLKRRNEPAPPALEITHPARVESTDGKISVVSDRSVIREYVTKGHAAIILYIGDVKIDLNPLVGEFVRIESSA